MVPSAKLIPASKSNAGDDSTPSLDSESALNGDLPDNCTNGAKISPPQRKRQQTGKVVDRKPKVRRRIGRVEGITTMPLEIFTEIASYLKMDDLVSLSRANKLLRGTLMTRAAINIWRAAEQNDEGLPPCPTDLSHPQYAVLLFFRNCSICGRCTTQDMIFRLRVRLCWECADDQIMTNKNIKNADLTPIDPEKLRSGTCVRSTVPRLRSFRYLKRDLEDVIQTRLLMATKGKPALAQWEKERKLSLAQHVEQTILVEAYITRVEVERAQEIRSLSAQRDKDAGARLIVLEWEKGEIERARGTFRWKCIVSRPQPLTDRIWNHIYSEILEVLLQLRGRDPAPLIQERLAGRQEHLHKLLSGIRIARPPLVDVTIGDAPRRSSPSYKGPYLHFKFGKENAVDAPFPTTGEGLTWPLLTRLVERDIPKEEMERAFNEQRDEIERAILDWQTRVDDEVMDIWRAGHPNRHPNDRRMSNPEHNGSSSKVVGALPACTLVFGKPDGSTTSDINELPQSHQLLLRADTLMKQIAPQEECSMVTQTFRPLAYPDIVPERCSIQILGALYQGDSWDSSLWASYPEAEEIACSLLQHLGRPDATHAEMDALRLRFSCMRCNNNEAKSWDALLEHYLEERQLYLDVQEQLKLRSDFEQMIFHDNHDVGGSLDRPLVNVMTNQELEDHACTPGLHQEYWVSCNICGQLSIKRDGHLSAILIHLQDVHEVSEPVVDRHYTIRRTKGDYV